MKLNIKIYFFIVAGFFCSSLKGQVTFIIESLPSSTPESDTIFMSGTFNDWKVHDIKYMLHPQLNGTYSVNIPNNSGKFEYKFTRGSWTKVETNERNDSRPNRLYASVNERFVKVKILNWQDLGGAKRFNYLILFLFVAAFNGLALLALVNRMEKVSKNKLKIYNLLNILIILTLIGGIFHSQTNPIWQLRIALGGYLILFAWGPSLAIFLGVLCEKKTFQHIYIHYLAVIFIAILVFLMLINYRFLDFLQIESNTFMSFGNSLLLWLGLGVNVYYHFRSIKYIQIRRKEGAKIPRENQIINIIFLISMLCIVFMSINFLSRTNYIFWGILQKNVLVLIFISLIIFVEFYFYLRSPEILHDKTIQSNIGNAKYIIDMLTELMEKKKPYTDPDLNISELSEMLNTKPHILSKILNEYFNKNFRDFINEYRVNEFISISKSDKYKNYKFLALAHEAGFNSKSTFNLAFKKMTNRSPTDYLKKHHNIIID